MPKLKFKRHTIQPDAKYSDVMIAKFINQIMLDGKKSVASKIVYDCFDIIENETKKDSVEVFRTAMSNVSPLLEVKPRRVGGATYQVPMEVKGNRKISLAMKWIIQIARKRKGKSMSQKLARELIEASENKGEAIKKKENTHRMAEANRAFAHFAF